MLAEVNRKCEEAITVNASAYSLNHVCCVCQCSLNDQPLNPELQTSHGYCQGCLDTALQEVAMKITDHSMNCKVEYLNSAYVRGWSDAKQEGR